MPGLAGQFCQMESPLRVMGSADFLSKLCNELPYLPVYRSIPCISRPLIFDGKKSNLLISLLDVHGILILPSSISGTVDSQKIKGLKRLIVLWFSGCCMCGHFVLEFRKSSQKIEHVNLKLTCFVVQG